MTRISTYLAVALCCFFLSSLQTMSQSDTDCNDDDEVSKNSSRIYRSNRNTVLSNLGDRSSLGSYSNTTAGLSPDTVYGMFLCIGNITRTSCSHCVRSATLEMTKTCGSYHDRTTSFSDDCIVRYSDFNFFTLLEDAPSTSSYSPIDSLDSSQFFNQTLPGKLEDLILRASSSSLIPYFVEDQERVTQLEGSYDLEAMVQCSPDLVPGNCTMCLRLAVKRFFKSANQSQARWAHILFPKCIVKYNISALQTSLGVKKGNEILGRTFIAMMTALVLALIGV